MLNRGKSRLIVLVTLFLTGINSFSFAGNYYEGNYKDQVKKLLNAAGAWDCPYNAPKFKAEGCSRDRQVAAAVTAAWQAECLARDGETDKANSAAEKMYNYLKSAAGMCNKISVSLMDGENACNTEQIFDCAEF